METETYIAIDLKSFYASVECVERGLDPLGVNLVVADESRTEKTICLAVSPSLKAHGISGRARLFEVIQRVKEINTERLRRAPNKCFVSKSYIAADLAADPSLELGYIVACPQMTLYMQVSQQIYGIYLKYVAPEDIHIYSVDEVFIDATKYLRLYRMNAYDFATMLIRDVLRTTGITATAGIGTNMYLAKIAMDIVAKRAKADADGVRIATLDEQSYRKLLWGHTPLTDFWRVGHGISRRLEANGMFTMGDVARMSVDNEAKLYKMFGINAELLIDHAWGWEPCRISDIKGYVPVEKSISSGQVLKEPYTFDKARIVIREMADALSLDLVRKKLRCDQIALSVGYDTSSLSDPNIKRNYHGAVDVDHYGRCVPRGVHGSNNLGRLTASSRRISDATIELFDRIVEPELLVRRMYVCANHITSEGKDENPVCAAEQIDLFTDYAAIETVRKKEESEDRRERSMQDALLRIKERYGKNAILRGVNFEDGATARERNAQIGGHRA